MSRKLGSYEKIENKNSNAIISISEIVVPFSRIISKPIKRYIYSGNENIPFRNRNPIFKSLMRIEFEDAIRDYLKMKK